MKHEHNVVRLVWELLDFGRYIVGIMSLFRDYFVICHRSLCQTNEGDGGGVACTPILEGSWELPHDWPIFLHFDWDPVGSLFIIPNLIVLQCGALFEQNKWISLLHLVLEIIGPTFSLMVHQLLPFDHLEIFCINILLDCRFS